MNATIIPIIPITISIVALFVSVFVAWKNYLSPFCLSIHSGNPRLEPMLYNSPSGQVMRFAVVLPLHFVNSGAQDGLIRDIVLVVHTDNSDWVFIPGFYCDYTVSTEATLGENLTKKSLNVPFYPIHLQGKGTLYKSIIFVPDAANKYFPIDTNNLIVGKYQFVISTLETDRFDYKEKFAFNITFNEDQIKDVNMQRILIPFIDEVKNKRQILRPANAR